MKQPIYNGANEDECEYYDVVQGEIEYNKMNKLKEKLKTNIKYHIDRIAETGSSSFSTCDYSGWDKDIWNHRHSIVDKLIDLGFNVDTQMNWEVLDITITKTI